MVITTLYHTSLAIVIFIFCYPRAILASSGDDRAEKPYQVSFGYWNDNLLFADRDENESFQGRDDYVTASLWLQGALNKKETWWLLDLYYTLLTNKTSNYRIDLVTFRLSADRELPIGSVQVGTVMIVKGDFGGSTIQNGYHRLMGYDRVTLPYEASNKAGPIFFFRFSRRLLGWRGVRLAVYVSDAHRFRVGPSALRVGDEFALTWWKNRESLVFHIQVHTGYIRYHDRGKYLSSLFD